MNATGKATKTSDAFVGEFEALWSDYPRKVDRVKAFRAYVARRREGVSADDLLSATRHYARSTRSTEGRFIKHASTFFGPDAPYVEFIEGIPEGTPVTVSPEAPSRNMAIVEAVVARLPGNQGRELAR